MRMQVDPNRFLLPNLTQMTQPRSLLDQVWGFDESCSLFIDN